MINPHPRTTVEVVEAEAKDISGGVLPNEVRINGLPVTVARDSLTIDPGGMNTVATVTLTLIVDEFRIRREVKP